MALSINQLDKRIDEKLAIIKQAGEKITPAWVYVEAKLLEARRIRHQTLKKNALDAYQFEMKHSMSKVVKKTIKNMRYKPKFRVELWEES